MCSTARSDAKQKRAQYTVQCRSPCLIYVQSSQKPEAESPRGRGAEKEEETDRKMQNDHQKKKVIAHPYLTSSFPPQSVQDCSRSYARSDSGVLDSSLLHQPQHLLALLSQKQRHCRTELRDPPRDLHLRSTPRSTPAQQPPESAPAPAWASLSRSHLHSYSRSRPRWPTCSAQTPAPARSVPRT